MGKEMKRAVGAVKACFERARLQKGDVLLLACSGGRDSLALATTSQICARQLGLFLAAAVVDHGIQEGSEKVAREAVDRLKEIGIQNSRALKTSLDPREIKINGIEAAAREARYGALQKEAKRLKARALLLAHTRTDQAESILLDACKTPSSSSWKGMEEESKRGDLLYLRPLLSLSRAETTAICKERGILWWDDPTNGKEGEEGKELPRRSRIRSEVMPKLEEISGGGAEAHLASFASMHREDEEFLNSLALEALKEADFSLPFSLPLLSLSSLPLPVKRRCCRIILKSFLGKRGAVEKQVETFIGILDKGRGQMNLPSLLCLRVQEERVVIDLCNN